jgi:hypothetical protein
MHQTEIFLMKQIEKYKAQVERVRELHYEAVMEGAFTWCDNCHFHYPCPTIKALDGEQ